MIGAITHTVRSTGGAWMQLAAGTIVGTAVTVANVSGLETRVSMRLARADGGAVIVPDALLPAGAGQSSRMRLIPLPMIETDAIEVLSDMDVDWIFTGREVIDPDTHIMRIAQTSGDAWTTIWSGPAEIHGLICANLALGDAAVSLRLWDGTNERVIVNADTLEEGGTGRILPVATIVDGTALQARSVGSVDYIISGMLR